MTSPSVTQSGGGALIEVGEEQSLPGGIHNDLCKGADRMEGKLGEMGGHVLEKTEREPGTGEQHEISEVSPQFEPEQDMRRAEEEEQEGGTEKRKKEGVETAIEKTFKMKAREQEEKSKNSIIMDYVLPRKSAEHREVSELFHQMDHGHLQILSIEKITNDSLEEKFEERKRAYSEMYGDVDVHYLWHGNKSENIPTILRFSLSGMSGMGVRFSSSPQMASDHCDQGETGTMLLCKVLVSTMPEVCEADWESNERPVIDGHETNTKEGWTVIIKFDDYSFLPTHVVHFKRPVQEEKEDEIDSTFYNYAQDLSTDCESVDIQAELDKLYEQMVMEAEVRREEIRNKEEQEILQAQHDQWAEDLRLAEVQATRQFSLRAYEKRMEELEMLEILTHQHTLWQEDLEEECSEKDEKYITKIQELWLDERIPDEQPNLGSREGAQNQGLKDEQHLAAEQNQALGDEQPEQNKVTKFLLECKKEDVNSLWGYH